MDGRGCLHFIPYSEVKGSNAAMRAIFAILPLVGLLCCLSPAPEGSSGMWAMGLKSSPNLNAVLDGRQMAEPSGTAQANGLIDSLLRTNASYPATRQPQQTGTMLADSVMVR
jgi:hypothetical protein